MVVAGVDVGSITSKAAILDADSRQIIGTAQQLTGWTPRASGSAVLHAAMEEAGVTLAALNMVIGTGYGRVALPFVDDTVTEISCQARGAFFLTPTVRTVMDIGGQDSKAISVDEYGHPREFAMNDRCAAGTGRFLQVVAEALGVELDELGRLALTSTSPVDISSVCAVFAESEIVGLIANGVSRADIAGGLCEAVARRTCGLLTQVGIRKDLLLTGGVAYNDGVLQALCRETGISVTRADRPELVGAVGAALIAAQRVSDND